MKTRYLLPLAGFLIALFVSGSFIPAFAQEQTTDIDKIKAELNNETVTFDFKEIPLEQVIEEVRDRVTFNIIIHERVNEKLTPEERKITINLKEIQLKQALQLILDMKNLSAMFENGVVQVVPEEGTEEPYLQIYDARDLASELKDFPGPDLQLRDPDPDSDDGLNSRGTQGGVNRVGGSTPGGRDQESFFGGGFREDKSNEQDNVLNDAEKFKQLIQANTGDKGDWNKENVTFEITKKGMLTINQTKSVHQQVQHLLHRLRGFR